MKEEWAPGEHWVLIAPTGEAKTTFAGGILRTRRYVLVFDVKGGDETIDSFGWPRLTKWPLSREDQQKMRDGEPVRYIVGARGRSAKARQERRALQVKVLEGALEDGHWTIFADDLITMVAPRFMGAHDQVEEMLILARGAKISVVSALQRTSSGLPAAADQATWMGIGYSRDDQLVQRLSEMMGRSRAEIRGAVAGLAELPKGYLVVNRSPRSPIIVTRPDKL